MHEDNSVYSASFAGQWIGETQGCEMPAHLWEITQHGTHLYLRTRWEGESRFARFYATLIPGESAFSLPVDDLVFKAILVDKQYFVIANWCTGTKGDWDGESPTYDVIFSRPGIAELTARGAYLKSQEQSDAASSQGVPPRQRESNSRRDRPE